MLLLSINLCTRSGAGAVFAFKYLDVFGVCASLQLLCKCSTDIDMLEKMGEKNICIQNATRLLGVTSCLGELKSEIKIECTLRGALKN